MFRDSYMQRRFKRMYCIFSPAVDGQAQGLVAAHLPKRR